VGKKSSFGNRDPARNPATREKGGPIKDIYVGKKQNYTNGTDKGR